MPKYIETPQTPENLKAMADLLDDHAAQLRVAAEQMGLHHIETLMVTNADQRRRAMEYLESWIGAVRQSIRKSRETRGDFGAVAEEPPKKKSK